MFTIRAVIKRQKNDNLDLLWNNLTQYIHERFRLVTTAYKIIQHYKKKRESKRIEIEIIYLLFFFLQKIRPFTHI